MVYTRHSLVQTVETNSIDTTEDSNDVPDGDIADPLVTDDAAPVVNGALHIDVGEQDEDVAPATDCLADSVKKQRQRQRRILDGTFDSDGAAYVEYFDGDGSGGKSTGREYKQRLRCSDEHQRPRYTQASPVGKRLRHYEVEHRLENTRRTHRPRRSIITYDGSQRQRRNQKQSESTIKFNEPEQPADEGTKQQSGCHHKNVKTDENTCAHCQVKWSLHTTLPWSQCEKCSLWLHDKCFWVRSPNRRRSQQALQKELYIDMNHSLAVEGAALESRSDDGNRRHSTRERKGVYSSLNEVGIQSSLQKKIEEEQRGMYDMIKRRRRQTSESQQDDTEGVEEDEEEDGEEEDGETEVEQAPGYSLRKERKSVKRFKPLDYRDHVRRRRDDNAYSMPRSPIHVSNRRRQVSHHGSSDKNGRRRRNSSTSSSGTDDEERFERRKRKSMTQARHRCLPMNFQEEDVTGVLKDRNRAREQMGSSLADIDPMSIDTKTTFQDIGGLDRHIRALKEMVIFPLLYPEVFTKFAIAPPRGVLFYGPPGTGKTLVARALANECSMDGQKVAFFMRKGADCLSKWVGESERQLRLLFDQAYSMRPSIIFFDEIDGLAPVRSTRQDQIHSSIVSTLLALMDGLDSRREIVVIGATNRLDSIDPALRRPGRFDREFLFNLPDKKARERILEIHTSAWVPKLSKDFVVSLADNCVGYCGADVKALCTEAALFALRRRYPQIYSTNKKLVLNVDDIKIEALDFRKAMKSIVPASQRAVISPGRALHSVLKPLLLEALQQCMILISTIFPPGKPLKSGKDAAVDDDVSSDEELDGPSIYEPMKQQASIRRGKRAGTRSHSTPTESAMPTAFFSEEQKLLGKARTHRPRLLIHGESSNGQTTHVSPALLYSMEHLTVHTLDLPAIYGNSATSAEEVIAQIFREARRTAPSVIYIPHMGVWWNSISETTRATFAMLLDDLPPDMPVLLLATANMPIYDLPEAVQDMFYTSNHEISTLIEVYEVSVVSAEQRRRYFSDLFLVHALAEPVQTKTKACRAPVEELSVAPTAAPRSLSAEESARLFESEEITLRELRTFLRQCTWKLLADRKYKEFSRAVDLEEVDDYLDVIKEPMDLSTIMTKINSHCYYSCAHYLKDIDLIMNNCLEYNPDRDQFDKLLRNRACEMRDTAHAILYKDLDPDFEKLCLDIYEARQKRGFDSSVLNTAPSFMRVLPKHMHAASLARMKNTSVAPASTTAAADRNVSPIHSESPAIPEPCGSRFSRRVRGIHDPCIDFAVDSLPIEYRKKSSPAKDTNDLVDKSAEMEVEENAATTNVEFQSTTETVNTLEKLETDSDKENKKVDSQNITESEIPSESIVVTASCTPGALAVGTSLQVSAEHQYAKASPVVEETTADISEVALLKSADEKPAVKGSSSPEVFKMLSCAEDKKEPVAVKRALAFEELPEAEDEQAPPNKRVSIEGVSDIITSSSGQQKHLKDVTMLQLSDREHMIELIGGLVMSTDSFVVSELERVYAQVSHVICQHRRDVNKTLLVQELHKLISTVNNKL